MRLACSADFHIHDWLQHSEIDSSGFPSRLTCYRELAEDFVSFARDHKCDVAVIAGDLVHQSVLRPMVLDVLGSVIRTITRELPLIVTHGQHDIDTKKSELSLYHSSLSHLSWIERNNFYYADRPTVFNILGKSFFVCPWSPDHSLSDTKADVFIGHGMVSGAQNSEGYIFNSGFDIVKLQEQFIVSIVGDIHNSQDSIYEGRLVLIPGSPIQNSYKDAPITGFSMVDFDNEVNDLVFKSIQDIRPDFYHQFLYTDDPEKKSTRLVHYKLKTKKPKKESKEALGNQRLHTLSDVALKILDQAKIEDKNFVKGLILDAFENVKSTDRKIPRTIIRSVKIHNFLSIGDFELNFDEFLDSLVINGPNGSGKTSIFEAIYWALSGNTTRGIAVSDLINDDAEDESVRVELVLDIEGVPHHIVRSRDSGKPSLSIQAADRSSVSETQHTITSMIGLTAEDILLLCYFSAKKPVLFGDLGTTAKNSLMANVSGTSEVDVLKDIFYDRLEQTERKKIALSTRSSMLDGQVEQTQKLILDYLSKKNEPKLDNRERLLEKESNIVQALGDTFHSTESEEDLSARCRGLEVTISRYRKAADNLRNQMINLSFIHDRATEQISNLKKQLATAVEGTCPTCGHELHDENLTNSLVNEIERLRETLPDSDEIDRLSEEVKKYEQEAESISSDLEGIQSLLSNRRRLEKELSTVQMEILKLESSGIDYDQLIRHETEKVPELIAQAGACKIELQSVERLEVAENWIYGKLLKRGGPLVQELNNQTKILLQQEIDTLTHESGIKIKIDDKLDVQGNFLNRGFKRYDNLSTGQARIVDIVTMVALNNLFTQLYGLDQGVLGIVIFDEVLSFLDDAYIDFAHSLLDMSKTGKKLVISHDDRILSKFDYRLSVRLKEGKSNSEYAKSWA